MYNLAEEDLETDQIDAVKAFTQSEIDCDIYVEMPYGFAVPDHVLKLKKALEGIKQGAFLWFNRNRDALLACGFEPRQCWSRSSTCATSSTSCMCRLRR